MGTLRRAAVLVLLTLLGCVHGPGREEDPWRVVCTADNRTSWVVQPVAQDAYFHVKHFGIALAPWQPHTCNLWPWASRRGRIGYVVLSDPVFAADTNWTQWFDF